MATSEERSKILRMVADGQLSAAEAAELLASSKTTGETTQPSPEQEVEALKVAEAETAGQDTIEVEEIMTETPAEKGPSGKGASWLHIKVSDLHSGKRRVTVNIPLKLAKIGLRLGSAFAPELREVDLDEVTSALTKGENGMLVDVEDEVEGHHVQIYVD